MREIVKPATTRGELITVLAVSAVILAIAGVAVLLRAPVQATTPLAPYEVSAFDQLNPIEQGIYADLRTAAREIEYFHHELEEWPAPNALAQEFIAPFTRNAAWEKRGRMEWQTVLPEYGGRHEAGYLGVSADANQTGSFLLVLTHHHMPGAENEAPVEPVAHVWYTPEASVDSPTVLETEALAGEGWRRLSPMRGQDQMNRLRGE